MLTSISILSPTVGEASTPARDSESSTLAALPDRIRLALLSNGKPNTSLVLDGIWEVLEEDDRFTLAVRLQKAGPSAGATPEILEQIIKQADLVISATSD